MVIHKSIKRPFSHKPFFIYIIFHSTALAMLITETLDRRLQGIKTAISLRKTAYTFIHYIQEIHVMTFRSIY